ncbi:MAG: hypothetical protein V1746_01050 [bacterium]
MSDAIQILEEAIRELQISSADQVEEDVFEWHRKALVCFFSRNFRGAEKLLGSIFNRYEKKGEQPPLPCQKLQHTVQVNKSEAMKRKNFLLAGVMV